MARTLLRLLQRKFGGVQPGMRARVEAADEPSLTLWTDRILTAETIDAVFEPV